MATSEIKNLTGGAVHVFHVKLFIAFEPRFLYANLNLGGLMPGSTGTSLQFPGQNISFRTAGYDIENGAFNFYEKLYSFLFHTDYPVKLFRQCDNGLLPVTSIKLSQKT